MKNLFYICSISLFFLVVSCHRDSNPDEAVGEPSEANSAPSGEITISRQQFDASGMKTGPARTMMFSNEVSAMGTLTPWISGKAEINTLIAGRITKVNFTVGDQVKMGEALFHMESHEIILLQQEYAELVNQLTALESTYRRQKSLSDENIGAKKEFIQAESDYNMMLARAEGLKARLKMIHIDPSRVAKGTILSTLEVRSPIAGVVTHQDMVMGQYIDPGITVMEVLDPRKIQLSLKVFERDIGSLVVGQTVMFHVPGREDRIFEATLSNIGRSIDPETKSITCLAQLKKEDRGSFVNNLFVETRIITCQREAMVIPESALNHEADRDFAWILVEENPEQMTFRKVPVRTGVTRGGQTEIIGEETATFLLEGAYNLWSAE